MTDPVSVPPSLFPLHASPPTQQVDVGPSRAGVARTLSHLGGHLQPEPSLHYNWILFNMDLPRPEFCFFLAVSRIPSCFFLAFSNGLTEFCFCFFFS